MTEGKEKASEHPGLLTFALLFEAANHALNVAKAERGESTHFCLLSLVASAFCLEAFLNELGERRLSLWSQHERLSPREKLKRVRKRLNMKLHLDRRPFSSFRWVMRFRNSVAHGRTEFITLEEVSIRDDLGAPDRPSSTIEQACTLDTASLVVADVRAMIDALGHSAGFRVSPLLAAAHAAWVGTPSQ